MSPSIPYSLRWLGGLDACQGKEDTVQAKAGEAGKGDDETVPWVTVLTVFDIVQATLTMARLQDEGIPARIRQEAAARAIPVNVGILGTIEVLVPEPMLEKALDLL